VSRTDQPIRRLLLVLILALLAGGCVESDWTVCDDGRVCAPGRVCDLVNGTCSSPDEECFRRADLEECSGGARVCLGGKCVDSCGDGVGNGRDECDGDDLQEQTCAALGWYAGDVACSSDCTLDSSACSGACMDGHLDPSFELCDPTDRAATAGVNCVLQGYDAGRQGCGTDCASATNDPCMRFGWSVEDPVEASPLVDSMEDIWGVGDDLFVLITPGGVRSAADDWTAVGADGDGIRGRALWASSSEDIWVVNARGDGFLRWNGAVWAAVASPAEGLNEIWGSSASDVFAVGDLGVVVHFDGEDWTPQPTPASTPGLRAIWGVGGDEVYAAGEAGGLLRYDGRAWSAIDSGATETLTGVWAYSASEIWTISATTVRRFDGSGWTEMLALVPALEARGWIAGTGPDDVWLTGGADGIVRRYDGARWATLLDGDLEPQPLWVGRDAVAVGYQFGSNGLGTVRRWYGAGTAPRLLKDGFWQDVWALQSDVWIAVGVDTVTGEALALHSNGSRLESFAFDDPVFHVSGFGPGRAYAAGRSGEVFEWDGTEWSVALPRGGPPLNDLWTSGSSDVYVLTDEFPAPPHVRHFDGRSWTTLPPIEAPCGVTASRGWASSPDDIFVVGSNVLARFDGSAWTCYDEPGSSAYASVWGSGPGDVWVFEGGGDDAEARLHHWDGAAWTVQGTAGTGNLVGTAADDVFLGTSAHFDGRVWSPLRSSAMPGAPVFAIPSQLFMVTPAEEGLTPFIRTRFWNQRAEETSCSDGVDDDADGATDIDDEDCRRGRRGLPW